MDPVNKSLLRLPLTDVFSALPSLGSGDDNRDSSYLKKKNIGNSDQEPTISSSTLGTFLLVVCNYRSKNVLQKLVMVCNTVTDHAAQLHMKGAAPYGGLMGS